jgi:hypothetical protein
MFDQPVRIPFGVGGVHMTNHHMVLLRQLRTTWRRVSCLGSIILVPSRMVFLPLPGLT